MKPQHTPTPWHTMDTIVRDADEFTVCRPAQDSCSSARDFETKIANAALIVRAVNAHDDLIAALDGAEKAIKCALPFLDPEKEALFCGEWLNEIQETLAKAKGDL